MDQAGVDAVSMLIPGVTAPMAKGFIKGLDKVSDIVNTANKTDWINIPSSVITKSEDIVTDFAEFGLKDGMKLSSNEVLDVAEKFLGKGYYETTKGSGRFISLDNKRVFRMGDNDILGKHGGGRHVNFEILAPNPDKPGKMIVIDKIHIYLND